MCLNNFWFNDSLHSTLAETQLQIDENRCGMQKRKKKNNRKVQLIRVEEKDKLPLSAKLNTAKEKLK